MQGPTCHNIRRPNRFELATNGTGRRGADTWSGGIGPVFQILRCQPTFVKCSHRYAFDPSRCYGPLLSLDASRKLLGLLQQSF
jgi:hypothetical protein